MKKLNRAGFTLIELLAVITIMGILMLVAIPSVSRTIENSRRDTFADNAIVYINTVRNAVLADEITCGGVTASGLKTGEYYYPIDTTDSGTKDLMEKVAVSSWGSLDLTGYVKFVKSETDPTNGRTKIEYSVCLVDTQNHGTDGEIIESTMSRAKIKANDAPGCTPSGTACTLK